jgi:hypothetical protein
MLRKRSELRFDAWQRLQQPIVANVSSGEAIQGQGTRVVPGGSGAFVCFSNRVDERRCCGCPSASPFPQLPARPASRAGAMLRSVEAQSETRKHETNLVVVDR